MQRLNFSILGKSAEIKVTVTVQLLESQFLGNSSNLPLKTIIFQLLVDLNNSTKISTMTNG